MAEVHRQIQVQLEDVVRMRTGGGFQGSKVSKDVELSSFSFR